MRAYILMHLLKPGGNAECSVYRHIKTHKCTQSVKQTKIINLRIGHLGVVASAASHSPLLRSAEWRWLAAARGTAHGLCPEWTRQLAFRRRCRRTSSSTAARESTGRDPAGTGRGVERLVSALLSKNGEM